MQFNGTENYYKHELFNIKYTDGIKYLAEVADCYWLIDLVASYQYEPKFKDERFMVYHLKVNKDLSATVKISDGDENILGMQDIEYTDFPLSEIKLWFVDGILILPSEY